MTGDKKSVATVHLPFPSLENLKAAITPLLSKEGMFVETNFPPPVGTPVEMVLVIGDNREEAARFRGQVMSQEPNNAALKGKKGVQLKFHKLFPNAEALFASILPDFAKSEPEEEVLALSDEAILENDEADSGAETVQLSDAEVQKHLQNLSDMKKASEAERQQREGVTAKPVSQPQPDESKPDESKKSLVDDLEHLTKRPDISGFREIDFEESKTGAMSDDFSNLQQGSGGYDMSDMILGIDLGTCYSCVAVMKEGAVKVLADEKGFKTTPSVVSYLEDGTVIVGREAVAQMAKNPRTSIFGAKRFIGRGYHSPVVQNMIRFFPYKVVPDSENHTAIDIFGKAVSLESVSSEILKTMRNIAHDATGENTDKVIITVPAYYSDNQRQAVKDAGVLAGLQVLRIINEPTSAALAVGFNQKMQKRILIYDLGGGTFDVSVLDIKDNSFQVIATGGDTFLGGEDFDNRLVKWVLESSREEGIQLARNPVVFERLKQACEKAKCELSTKKETSINLPYIPTVDGKTINFQKPIDREKLVALTRDLVEKSVKLCDDVLGEVKLTIADVDEIVLVGGMTRMPFVRNLVHQHYSKKPFGDVNPDEAVAMGAAILGGEMTGTKKVSLGDVLSMSIGIALPKNRFKPILMKNSAVPCQKKYKITADLSQEFTIDVFQGESLKCDDNEYLGTLVFSDEVKGNKSQALEIEFDLNAECLLNCVIRNPGSGKAEKALLITHDTPPSAKLA